MRGAWRERLARIRPGGAPGLPDLSRHVQYLLGGQYQEFNEFYLVEEHRSTKGLDATAPQDYSFGLPGALTQGGPTSDWFQPQMLKSILLYAMDAYRGGNYVAARNLLNQYLALYKSYRSTTAWLKLTVAQRKEFDQIAMEMLAVVNGKWTAAADWFRFE